MENKKQSSLEVFTNDITNMLTEALKEIELCEKCNKNFMMYKTIMPSLTHGGKFEFRRINICEECNVDDNINKNDIHAKLNT